MSDTGAKGRSTTDEDEFSEITKLQNASIACGPTALVLGKKCDTWANGKDRNRAGSCDHFNISKTKKCVHCL